MEKMKINTLRTSRKTAECAPVVLKQTKTTRLVFLPTIVDNDSNPSACVHGILCHQKNVSGIWEDENAINLAGLKSGEGVRLILHSSELVKLKEALDSIYAIGSQGVPFDGSYSVVRENEALIVNGQEQYYIRELLRRELGVDVWNQLVDLQPDLATNLALARIQNDRKAIVNQFENNLSLTLGEKYWQLFLSKNDWIFGYGLTYYCMSTLGREVLVGGKTIYNQGGHICDFLLCTKGNAKFTSLVEIKCPNTKLIGKEARNGVYPISNDLSAALSQLQVYCNSWSINRDPDVVRREIKGNYMTVLPKGILVIGNTSELDNEDKKVSFELFRRHLHNIEILTYDELLERAKYIVSDKQDFGQGSVAYATSEFVSDDELPF